MLFSSRLCAIRSSEREYHLFGILFRLEAFSNRQIFLLLALGYEFLLVLFGSQEVESRLGLASLSFIIYLFSLGLRILF